MIFKVEDPTYSHWFSSTLGHFSEGSVKLTYVVNNLRQTCLQLKFDRKDL